MTELIGMKPARFASVRVFFSPAWFVAEKCECGYDVPIELGQRESQCVSCGAFVELTPPAAEP